MEERLIKFARIVEAGNFTRAAAQLRISQPALTTAVKKLERELQAELLIRGGHRLALTVAGAIAYESAKSLITETQNLETKIRQAAARKTMLNLGMIDSLATLLFIRDSYLEHLEQGARVSLTIDNSSRLIEQVGYNELDLALVVQPRKLSAALAATIIGEEPLVLVAKPELRARLMAEIAEGKLRHFLSYNQASHTHHIITEHFSQSGLGLQPAFYSTSPEIMLQLALDQRGAAVLPYLLVKPYLRQGGLEALRVGPSPPVIRRVIISLRRSGRALNESSEQLLIHAHNQLRQLNQEADGL